MTPQPPPYVITSIDGEPERDDHGNWSAFVQLDCGESALLRLKGPFPHVGDQITDRVLVEKESRAGNRYLKLEKPSSNGNRSNGGSAASKQDGPDESYWAGQNAAKGRAHAQEMALRAWALGFRPAAGAESQDVPFITPLVDFFQKDAEAARDRAVEEASAPAAAPAAAASPPPIAGNGAPPPEPNGPTKAQLDLMANMGRERGLDGAGMRAVLQSIGLQAFSQLPRNGCVDAWRDALNQSAAEQPDIPTPDPWPDEPAMAPAGADDDVPF